jgi:small subunit ribosomal protein S16
MLMLRLQRIGKTKSAAYRLVISEKTKDPQAGSLEILGQYDPTKKTKVINFNIERIKYWISKGAQPSNTVNNLLINVGVITGKKMKSVSLSKKRQTKIGAKKAEIAKKEEEAVKAAEAKKAEEAKKIEEAKQAEEAKKAAEAVAAAESVSAPVEPAPAVEDKPVEPAV